MPHIYHSALKQLLDAPSNIETARLEPSSDPATELREWKWYSRAVLHDSWAWMHATLAIFELSAIFDLAVLSFVTFRWLHEGHVWMGDAFSTISNMLLYRGVLALVCNDLNGYWTITEMWISIGDSITDQHVVYYRPELVHIDFVAVYLNLVNLLSYTARERVDPIMAFVTFEMGWGYIVELANLFPMLRANIANFAIADTTRGLLKVSAGMVGLSPMDLLTSYEIPDNRIYVILSVVISIFNPIVVITGDITARKISHFEDRVEGHEVSQWRRSSAYMAHGLQQIDLTSFESATGAALRKRYGVLSGYQNYNVRNNQLFATLDAVYSNGFLVANNKFSVGTNLTNPKHETLGI
ncbi:unnamed protein product [Phytophthora fragariaefolia]|uniref:Unnamed protein product n=1 Tax=Phytophthora fragariaefolia TaxID=1490495 RepID=A0A9W6XL95_9STRA|nr:unnamed protein product [Phytophthora fragariaefolia]